MRTPDDEDAHEASPAQALWRGPVRRSRWVWIAPRDPARDLRGDRRSPRFGRGDRHRDRWREHLPWAQGQRAGDGALERGLYGDARDRDQRRGAPGRPREVWGADAPLERARDSADRRALHSAARGSAPGEGPHRHLRGGHREPLLLDGYRRGAARHGDQGRRALQGHQGLGHLRQGSRAAQRREDVPPAELRPLPGRPGGRDGPDRGDSLP